MIQVRRVLAKPAPYLDLKKDPKIPRAIELPILLPSDRENDLAKASPALSVRRFTGLRAL